MLPKLKKLISLILSLLLILQQSVFAQTVSLNLAHYLNQTSLPVISDTFRPPHLRYISYDSQSNDFKLLLDKGDAVGNGLKPFPTLEDATQELMKYFFIGLALPNSAFWVNLRPDAPENIIDDDLAKTDIGRIFLEADVQLKKDTASWTSPQVKEGKAYWDKLYKKAGELFGTENITIPTLTRPWIVPDEIILRESPDNSAYIYKATLKVMLEEDYLKSSQLSAVGYQQYEFKDSRLKQLNQYSTQLIKELIIPKLTREINSSKKYASLRQAYYSLILAQHFKNKLRSESGPYSNLIDSRDLTNLTSQEPWDKRTYFKDYQKSFQQGEYNLSGSAYTSYGQSIRKYMSGGISLNEASSAIETIQSNKGRELSTGIMKKMLPYEFTAASSVEPYKGKLETKMVSSALEGKSLAGSRFTLDKAKEIFSSLGQDSKEKILMLTTHVFTLETLARDQDWRVREAAAIGLGQAYAELIRQGKEVDYSRLETLARDQDADVRRAAAIGLGQAYAELIRQGLAAQKDSDIVEKAVSFLLTQIPFSFGDISISSQGEDSRIEARDYFTSLDNFIFYLQITQARKISSQSLLFILGNKDYILRNPALMEILRRKSPLELLNDNLNPAGQDEGLRDELLESYKIAESLFVLERYAKETSERYHQRLEAYFRAGYYTGKLYLRYQEAYARHFERVGGIGFNVFSNADNTTVVVTRFGMLYNEEMTPAQKGHLRAEAGKRKINPAVAIVEEESSKDSFIELFNEGYPGHYKGDKKIILANLKLSNDRTIPIYTFKGVVAGEFPSRQIRINGKAIEVKFLGIDRNFSRVLYAVEDEVASICLNIAMSKGLLEEGKEFYQAWVKNMPESLFSIYSSLAEKDTNKAVAAIALDFAPLGVYGHSPAIMVLARLIEKGISKPEGTVNAEGFLRNSSSSLLKGDSISSALIIPAGGDGQLAPAITEKPETSSQKPEVSSAAAKDGGRKIMSKSLGRPAGNPIITYVSKPEDLRMSDNPKIKQIWNEMVEENLKLYEFAQELTRITRAHGFINKFPNEELENLREFYNYLDHKDLDYNLGFITFNGSIEEGGGSRLAARFKFNLLFLVSMVNAGIEPVEFFNKKNSRFLLNDEEFLGKIVTGTQLGPEGKEHYVWIIFKDKIEYILGLGKGTTFIKQFGKFLFETFRQKRQSYDKIARGRYPAEKPYMVILKQYRDQLQELIGSNSPQEYIEQQESTASNTSEGKIGQVGSLPGPRLPGESMGKVRKFKLSNGEEVYAKRVNVLRTRYPEEEITISLEARKSLKEISPYFDTQEFIGIMYDQGAFYLLSRAIISEQSGPETIEDIDDFSQFGPDVIKIMNKFGISEHEIQSLVVRKFGKKYRVLLDFETLPYRSVTNANDAPEALKSSSAVEGEEKLSVSSSINNPGGIDLRALPITTRSVLNQPLAENMPVAGSSLSLTINLDNELRQIQDMLKAGIMPSSERIREYALASSSLKPEDHSREVDQLLGCIADIFRLEEEKAKPTPQALKDALILLESDMPA